MRPVLIARLLSAASAAALVACSAASAGDATPPPKVCTPGAYVYCRCEDRSEGTKLCNDDGAGFAVCTCAGSGSTSDLTSVDAGALPPPPPPPDAGKSGGTVCGGSASAKPTCGADGNVHHCDAAGRDFETTCPGLGCMAFPVADDRCVLVSKNWRCADSLGSDTKQHWTCNVAANGHPDGDGNLYRCVDAKPQYVTCTTSCHPTSLNQEDYCDD
jgi:hypothetical protein